MQKGKKAVQRLISSCHQDRNVGCRPQNSEANSHSSHLRLPSTYFLFRVLHFCETELECSRTSESSVSQVGASEQCDLLYYLSPYG